MATRVLIAALVSLVAISASADPGFLPANSAWVPPAVQAARQSILKIRFPYYFTVSRKEAEAFLDATHLDAEGRKEIQDCLASSAKVCSFPIHYVDGTAFVDRKDTASLWTNCHLVKGWIQYQKYKSLQTKTDFKTRLRTEKLKVSLMDSRGVIVAEDISYQLEAAHPEDYETPEFVGCSFMSDAVRIKGPDLGRPGLAWGKIAKGDMTYVGGYPHETGGRAGVQLVSLVQETSDIFFWTRGILHSTESFNKSLENRGLSPKRYELVTRDIFGLIMTNDGAQGMSGGPILNEKGEVVGIFKGLFSAPDKNTAPLATLGIDTNGLDLIERIRW